MTTESLLGPALDFPLQAQLELLGEGSISSRDLTEVALARAQWLQPILQPFRCVLEEEALLAAEDADKRRANGERAPLLGIPLAIKDDVDLAGQTTPFGCGGLNNTAAQDSELVRRLRRAGAVIVGKTMTSEIGQWPFSESLAFGAARNPWHPDYSPGGSSGGAAAAVAAGIVPAAIGSDGAGSIRIPAAWCGLVGLKPQRGRISTWPHLDAFQGLTCFGPITRTAADAAIVLDAVHGNHEEDLHQPPSPDRSFHESLKLDPGPLRVALSFATPPGAPNQVDPEIERAVWEFAETLESLGHKVIEADPSYALAGPQVAVRGACGIREWADEAGVDMRELEPRTRTARRLGRALRGAPLRLARNGERRLQETLGRIFGEADVVLTPTTAQLPPKVGEHSSLGWWRTSQAASAACPYTWAWNVVGWPAISVPVGRSQNGLPIGAQLLGMENAESMLLRLASEAEHNAGCANDRPPVPHTPLIGR